MSSTSPHVIEYLTRQLSRNPIHESGEIVRARAKAFKLEQQTSTPTPSATPSGQRQKVRDELERIREHCFTGPVEPMLRSLVTLPLNDYPDLAALARRLRVILDTRAKLPALSQNPHFDGDFFSVLKQVLASPARDVAVLREQVLASFRQRRNRKRGQAMIRLLKSETPELYALEADWLDSLARYRGSQYLWGASRNEAATLTTQSSGSDSRGWPIWIFVVVTVGMLRALSGGFDREAPKQPTIPFRAPSAQQSIESQRVDESLERLNDLQRQHESSRHEHLRRMAELMAERRESMQRDQEEARKRTEDYFNTFDDEDKEFLQPSGRDEVKGSGETNSQGDFNSPPFATPRVVPMPGMPSFSPRP